MLKIFFPERLGPRAFLISTVVVFAVAAGAAGPVGLWLVQHGFSSLDMNMVIYGVPFFFALGFACARAKDIRKKSGNDLMAHLGYGLPLLIALAYMMAADLPAMLRPEFLKSLQPQPLMGAGWLTAMGMGGAGFLYLLVVGPRDAREQPVDVEPDPHPFLGVQLALCLLLLAAYAGAVGCAYVYTPAALKSAEKGNAAAQFDLSVMYDKGIGVERDTAAAVKWLTRAADKNHAQAQYYLALRTEGGWGVPLDMRKAISLYTRSAEQGYGYAQLEMGNKYAQGKGVERDYLQAYKWYDRAAGGDPALRTTSAGASLRDGLLKLMTPEQRKKI